MSIINRIQPVPQPRRRSSIEQQEAENRKKLTRKEVAFVASVGIGGIAVLFLIGWLLLPFSGKILPFVMASAWPLLALIVVTYQAVVYRRQWNAMLDSLKQTDRVIDRMQLQLGAIREQTTVMQNSLVETQKMVRHSERSVEIAEHNMEYAQRAYITVSAEWGETGFKITVRNSGNTPTIEATMVAITDFGITPPNIPETWGDDSFNLCMIAPRDPRDEFVAFKRIPTPEESKDATGEFGDMYHWWVTGLVYYRDIFSRDFGDYRETDFCFYFDQRWQKTRPHLSGNETKEYRGGKQVNEKKYPDWWKS